MGVAAARPRTERIKPYESDRDSIIPNGTDFQIADWQGISVQRCPLNLRLLPFEFQGFVRAEYFFFFLVRQNSMDFVALRVLEVVGGLEVRGWLVRHYSLDYVAGGATLFVSGGT